MKENMECIEKDFIKNKKKEVPDLNCNGSIKYLFIFESPHKNELEKGCPIAGKSGQNLTRLFNVESKEALGLLIQNNLPNKDPIYAKLNQIGIMNVCQYPLQKAAYQTEDQNALSDETWKYLNLMRKCKRKILPYILNDFKARLQKYQSENNNLKIFAFGQFAKETTESFCMNTEIYDFPHPSFFFFLWKHFHETKFKELLEIS